MTLLDATIALLLTARIHGTDAAVRATAKRCVKLLPRSKRDVLFQVVGAGRFNTVCCFTLICGAENV
ncbi:hypothetical protein P3C61_07670 [Pseudomonas aeruginosa]|uniref:DUF7740 domain-containing protein n=1 Tax=Pseudomonas aeruginosa TaxID=287 RepID=UPI0021BBCC68|nr:hypothetical protein [Pseudomonas aeruginosa]